MHESKGKGIRRYLQQHMSDNYSVDSASETALREKDRFALSRWGLTQSILIAINRPNRLHKGRFCNTMASVPLAHTSFESD